MTFSVDTDLNRILELINDNIIESSNFINDPTLNSLYLDSNSNAKSSKLGIILYKSPLRSYSSNPGVVFTILSITFIK